MRKAWRISQKPKRQHVPPIKVVYRAGDVMSHQWAQFDHHDTKQCLLSDDEQTALIKAWQQSGSFDDVITEIQGDRNGN